MKNSSSHLDVETDGVVMVDYAELERRILLTGNYLRQADASARLMSRSLSFGAVYGRRVGDSIVVDEIARPETQHSTTPQPRA